MTPTAVGPNPGIERICAHIQSAFPQAIKEVIRFLDELTIVVERASLVDVCTFVRDDPALAFNYLCDLSAVDVWPAHPRFEVNIHLLAIPAQAPEATRLRIQVRLDEHETQMPTLSGVWPSSAWYERETHDLFGIDFPAHPDLRPLLLPQNWSGPPPLRRDIPVQVERVAFSFNRQRIYRDKLFAREQDATRPAKEPAPIESAELSRIKHLVSPRALTGETTLLNVGPQHPITHGSLQLLLELDGENSEIVTCIPHIGYLHSGIEKSCEDKTYSQIIPLAERVDYVSPLSSNLGYVLAVEKLMGAEVPLRAQYIRVILTELSRIASHTAWLGSNGLDIGATKLFLHAFRERERILDIFKMCSGQRMTGACFCVGGLWRDVPEDFEPAVRQFLAGAPDRIREYERLLQKNPTWKKRTVGIGVISAEQAIAWSLGGPCLRGCGVDWDLRKAAPYSCYDHFEFDVPLGSNGDAYDRYRCRILELWASLRIVEQALDKLPDGPIITDDRKIAPPPKNELAYSMAAVIHHFKLWTEGFRPPQGQVYHAIESPRGEFGVYINSDGSGKPRRIHFRTPTFANLQALPIMTPGLRVTDLLTVISSIDPLVGEVDR